MQRYGREVNGGAEYLCKLYAEQLAGYYDVTVLTSCAVDYLTWENEYPPGEQTVDGIKVIRYPSVLQRDMYTFVPNMQRYYAKDDKDFYDDFIWMEENGPVCPDIFRYIREHKQEYDVFIFVCYLYYPTTFCMGEVAEKAILIPTAHDEQPIHECEMFQAIFSAPAGIIFLTDEERQLVHKKFNNAHIPSVTTGSGITPPDEELVDAHTEIFHKNGLEKTDPYIVYIGRIEQGKSCGLLFDSFLEYKAKYGDKLKLVLAGKTSEHLLIPEHSDIVYAGFVSEEEKFALVKNADVLVLPSQNESLSLVVLEAMTMGVPVIVNANCEVLKGHIDKSGGGLYFYDQRELTLAIRHLVAHSEARAALGERGKAYMDRTYSWDTIIGKIQELIEKVCAYA